MPYFVTKTSDFKNVGSKVLSQTRYDPGEGTSQKNRRAKSSFVNPQPDFNDKARNIKIQLFQNGHINRRLKNPIYAMNTCALDAIIHIFIAIYRDCEKVQQLLNTKEQCIFGHFLKLHSKEGVTERMYAFRTDILKAIGSNVEDGELTILKGSCNLEFIFNKLVFPIFTSKITTDCTQCGRVSTRRLGYMPCEAKQVYNEGIQSIKTIISSPWRY